MDNSPIRQTFIFENNFSKVEKSVVNLVKLSSLVAKYCKMSKKYSPVKFANFVYFCITNGKALSLCGNLVTLFPAYAKVYKILKLYITIFWTFYNILQPNFTISLNLGSSFQLC